MQAGHPIPPPPQIICNTKRYMLHIANDMIPENAVKKRRRGATAEFVEDKLARGFVSFTLPELIEASGLSAVAANNQLRRLRSQVVRVCRPQPFFLIVAPQYRPIGAPPVEWWLDDYFRWLEHPYYLALLSAAESYDAAPQAVQVHQVMTDAPRRNLAVGRLRLRFFVKRGIGQTPVTQPANAYAPLRVSTPEATALDLVSYAGRIGGARRVLETLAPLLPQMCARGMTRALDAAADTPTAQRLGYLLEKAGENRLGEVIHRWLPSEATWVRFNFPETDPCRHRLSERWRVVLQGEDEER